jgi:hypothetical protein
MHVRIQRDASLAADPARQHRLLSRYRRETVFVPLVGGVLGLVALPSAISLATWLVYVYKGTMFPQEA